MFMVLLVSSDLDVVELVVFVDEFGVVIGIVDKVIVYIYDIFLYCVFLCYVFLLDGCVLFICWVFGKFIWLGVWMNFFCGYFVFDEMLDVVIYCCVEWEFGFILGVFELVLLYFCYWVVDVFGIVENELCLVFCIIVVVDLWLVVDEVVEWLWIYFEDLCEVVEVVLFVFSFWLVL